MKKRFISALLVLAVMLCMTVPALAAAPETCKATYEGRGRVEVDFNTDVQYKNVSVTVRDPAGKKLSARITDKDDDDLDFSVTGLQANTKYSFVISGVRKEHSGAYGTVKGTFRTPKHELGVRKAEYDKGDKELELKFYGSVQYKNPKVVIRDAAGKTYSCRITDLDNHEMEIFVKGLRSGKYTVKISGIRLKGSRNYTSISATFRVK